MGLKRLWGKKENLMGKEGEVDFDDGLLPDPEEEEVEYLSDDRVFQALNEDLDVSMQS